MSKMFTKLVLPAITVLLCLGLLIFSTLYQRESDSDRLAHAATAPLYTGAQQSQQESAEPTLADAPNVQIYDAEGNPVQIDDFKGKPMIVSFWASWSDPSKAELEIIESCYETYQDDVLFLMINQTDGVRETKETAKAYWDSRDTRMTTYYDTDSAAGNSFQADTAPSTFFINAEGKIVAFAEGGIPKGTVERGIRMSMETTAQ